MRVNSAVIRNLTGPDSEISDLRLIIAAISRTKKSRVQITRKNVEKADRTAASKIKA